MKRLILIILLFITICFILQTIFTKKANQETVTVSNSGEAIEEQNQSNSNIVIRLLHTKTNEIQELNMDEYLYRSCCSRDASKF